MFADNQGFDAHNYTQMVKDIMQQVDKNNDNFISYEEFNDALTLTLNNCIEEWLTDFKTILIFLNNI